MHHAGPRLERKLRQLPTPDPAEVVEVPIRRLPELEPFGDGADRIARTVPLKNARASEGAQRPPKHSNTPPSSGAAELVGSAQRTNRLGHLPTPSSPAESTLLGPILPEPFANTRKAAEFAAIKPPRLLDLVRAGKVRAYPVGLGVKRHQWVFRLSELAEDIASLRNPDGASMATAALVSRRRQSNG